MLGDFGFSPGMLLPDIDDLSASKLKALIVRLLTEMAELIQVVLA